MNEFTHDELQQVIRKYDSEYKRFKKIANGKPIFIQRLNLENGAKITELEERCQRAEKDNIQLKD
jgi:translation initiation factor 2 beta subunit (eIF-2beta)/eIF-5